MPINLFQQRLNQLIKEEAEKNNQINSPTIQTVNIIESESKNKNKVEIKNDIIDKAVNKKAEETHNVSTSEKNDVATNSINTASASTTEGITISESIDIENNDKNIEEVNQESTNIKKKTNKKLEKKR